MSPLLQKRISQTKYKKTSDSTHEISADWFLCAKITRNNNWSLPPPTYGVKHNIKERKRDKMNTALANKIINE